MDRFPHPDNRLIYSSVLEFIGEVRAGISHERFCAEAIGLFSGFMDFLHEKNEAMEFLDSRGVTKEYVDEHLRAILLRLHCNTGKNHYLTLGLPDNASGTEISRRWKELMLLYHPDRNRNPEAEDCAKRINEAFSVLKDPAKRALYDRKNSAEAAKKKRRPFSAMNPGVRAMALKFIIPSSAVISALAILIAYMENRPLKAAQYAQPLQTVGEEKGSALLRPRQGKGLTDQPPPQERTGDNLWFEASLFIRGYIRAYEEGDAERLSACYSRAAVEDGMDYEAIRKTYRQRLGGKKFRYNLLDTEFNVYSDSIIVSASYSVGPLPDKENGSPSRGRIRWVLSREKDGLKIMRIDYDRK